MKKFLVLLGFLLIFTASNVGATPIWFDADGTGDIYSPVLIDELSGEAASNYQVEIDLGTDGKLGDNDTFTETFTLGIFKGNLEGAQVLPDENPFPNQTGSDPLHSVLYADITITGTIQGYSNLGDPNIDTNESNWETAILDDTFFLDFDASDKAITLKYDVDAGNAPAPLTLGVFDVIGGVSLAFNNAGNETFTSQVDIDMVGDTLTSDVFFLDNSGAVGVDISTLEPNVLLLGLADASVNLLVDKFTNATAEKPSTTDGIVFASVDDNGTDVEFTPIPEPATFILFGFGLLGLAAATRKKIHA